jgi:cytochrome c553
MKTKKTVKKKLPELSTLRNKADALLQEYIRKHNDSCFICAGELSCGHHYFPKSMSAVLRYNLDNIIPICVKCHFRHHNGDPTIHAAVLKYKGQKWNDRLNELRKADHKESKSYYLEVIAGLTERLKNTP